VSVLTPNAEDHKPLTETHERNIQSSVHGKEDEEDEGADKDQEDEDSPKSLQRYAEDPEEGFISVTPARNSLVRRVKMKMKSVLFHTDNQLR